MFTFHKTDDGRSVPSEYLPSSAQTLDIGTMLTVEDGALITATGTTKPTYMSLTRRTASEGEIIPVARVASDIILEAETDIEDLTTVKLGDKCAISNTGDTISAVQDDGPFEVVGINLERKTLLVRAI